MLDNFDAEIAVMGTKVALTQYKLPLDPDDIDCFDEFQDGLKIDVYEKGDWYANTKWKGKHFGLPSPRKNVYYIVSRIMAYHNLDRKDLLIPESSSNKETKYLYRMVIDK